MRKKAKLKEKAKLEDRVTELERQLRIVIEETDRHRRRIFANADALDRLDKGLKELDEILCNE